MAKLDGLDIRILRCITGRRHYSRNEVHSWLVEEMPNIALLQHRLDRLEGEGLIRFEPGRGYIRTREGTLRTRRLIRRR